MRKPSKPVVITAVIVALLLVVRALLPVGAEYYLNNRLLADLGDYTGRVGDVDLALWRGAVRVEALHIEKKGERKVRFVTVPMVEASLSWRTLSQGSLQGSIYIEHPQVNFVDATAAEDRQAGLGLDWQALTEDWVEFTLEEIVVRNGEVAFRNFTSDPPVDLRATNIQVDVSNLTNVAKSEGKRVAEASVSADFFDESPFSSKARFDPFDFKSFDYSAELQVKDLTRLNDFARAYANLDLTSGHGNILTELEAQKGKLNGYVKVHLQDLEVLDWQQDVEQQDDSLLHLAWESMAGMAKELFSNFKSDKLATRVEISGDISQPDVSVPQAVFSVLRNAFVEALGGGYEGITPFTNRDQKSGQADDKKSADKQ